jgi:hypothetical protein
MDNPTSDPVRLEATGPYLRHAIVRGAQRRIIICVFICIICAFIRSIAYICCCMAACCDTRILVLSSRHWT